MSKIVILDNGHSGMVGGQYLTAGKRSPNWKYGVLYEGAFNRWVTNLMMRELDYAQVPYFHVSPELKDVPLATRTRRANQILESVPNTYLLSVHANAGGGTGMEGFTTRGDTPSDPIGEFFLSNLEAEFTDWRMRFDNTYDGDKDKEKNYWILRKFRGPAFLIELGFMDHKKDYERLWSQDFQQKVACNLAQTIIKIYRNEEYA